MEEFKKILSAYKSVLDKKYNFEGIIVNPVFSEDGIFWEFKNPKDLSVSKERIQDFVSDIIYDLSKYVGGLDIGSHNKLNKLKDYGYFPRGGVYLNDIDRNKIWDKIDKITQMRFKTSVLDIDIVGFRVENTHAEEFYMGFDVIMRKGFFNDMEITNKDMLINLISRMFYDDDFRDYEYDLFNRVNIQIAHNPLLFDDNYTYFTHDIIPYDKNGNKIYLN